MARRDDEYIPTEEEIQEKLRRELEEITLYWQAQRPPTYSSVFEDVSKELGLSNAQKRYFHDATYGRFMEESPDARDLWWNVLTAANIDRNIKFSRFMRNIPHAASQTMGDPLAQNILKGQAKQMMQMLERTDLGMKDPWRAYLEEFPFMEEWYKMTPQRRGERSGWISTTWK